VESLPGVFILNGAKPIALYIDADACPVKQEVYRVAERHALKGIAIGRHPYSVMAGLVPAIHDFAAAWLLRRRCPQQSPDQVRGRG
jgi:hypothetical protein